MLQTVAVACTDVVAAEARVRNQFGPAREAVISRDNIILPLTPWSEPRIEIRDATRLEYGYVACSLIAARQSLSRGMSHRKSEVYSVLLRPGGRFDQQHLALRWHGWGGM